MTSRDDLDRSLAGKYEHPETASYATRDATYSAYSSVGDTPYAPVKFNPYASFDEKEVPEIKKVFCPECGGKSLDTKKGVCSNRHSWKM